MGLLGGLFGGGSTKVTQKSSNTTNVDVGFDLQNVIDLSSLSTALQDVLGKFAESVSKIGGDTNAVLKTLSEGQKIQVLALLSDVQQRAKQNEMINALLGNGSKYLKIALAAGAVWFVWKKIL